MSSFGGQPKIDDTSLEDLELSDCTGTEGTDMVVYYMACIPFVEQNYNGTFSKWLLVIHAILFIFTWQHRIVIQRDALPGCSQQTL